VVSVLSLHALALVRLPLTTWTVAAIGTLSYLVGGIPVGWLLVRRLRYGLDVREYGSGNVGTSNVYRHAGIALAAVVGPLQFLQGLLPVLMVHAAGLGTDVQVLAGICAVIGNGWPVYLGFNGGRCIAVATGVVAGLSPTSLLVLLGFYVVGAVGGGIAVGVLAGFIVLPVVGSLLASGMTALGFLAILILMLLRRLEGVLDDARRYDDRWRIVLRRVIRDERPGRPLVGRHTAD
jgi:glycerol-3-phosphate acyltransferase PlsY